MNQNHLIMRIIYSLLLLLFPILVFSQDKFESSSEQPFGAPNPDAPNEINDFKPMIGLCDCNSETRKPDGSWAAAIPMTWKFKYIMNGMAIQDETLKSDGVHSGSIRQYNPDSAKWFVHYYTTAAVAPVLPVWTGTKKGDRIILYKEQKAPNGMEGYYRLSFYDMTDKGYKWIGEWVNKDESIIYPTWKIDCKKKNK